MLEHYGQERFKVLCRRRALPDHNPHPDRLFQSLADVSAFVVAADPGGEVRVERRAGKARGAKAMGVAVEVASRLERRTEFRQHARVTSHDAEKVHHLGQPNRVGPLPKKRAHIFGGDGRAA